MEAAFEGKPLSQMVKHRTLVSEAARLRKFESRPKTTKKKKINLKKVDFLEIGFFLGWDLNSCEQSWLANFVSYLFMIDNLQQCLYEEIAYRQCLSFCWILEFRPFASH